MSDEIWENENKNVSLSKRELYRLLKQQFEGSPVKNRPYRVIRETDYYAFYASSREFRMQLSPELVDIDQEGARVPVFGFVNSEMFGGNPSHSIRVEFSGGGLRGRVRTRKKKKGGKK